MTQPARAFLSRGVRQSVWIAALLTTLHLLSTRSFAGDDSAKGVALSTTAHETSPWALATLGAGGNYEEFHDSF